MNIYLHCWEKSFHLTRVTNQILIPVLLMFSKPLRFVSVIRWFRLGYTAAMVNADSEIPEWDIRVFDFAQHGGILQYVPKKKKKNN